MFQRIIATILNFMAIVGGRFADKFQMAGMNFNNQVKTTNNPLFRNWPVPSFQRIKFIFILLLLSYFH